MNTAINIAKIFKGNTFLHLIIWDRIHDLSNILGLLLVGEIIKKFDKVLPLIRPLGRKYHYYKNGNYKEEFRSPIPNSFSNCLPISHILADEYLSYCELWLQVNESQDMALKTFLNDYTKQFSPYFGVFLYRDKPIWQPLSDDWENCQYLQARNGFYTKILCDFSDNAVSYTHLTLPTKA